jgi:hypothetical protein
MTTLPVMGHQLCDNTSFMPMREKKRNLQRVPRKKKGPKEPSTLTARAKKKKGPKSTARAVKKKRPKRPSPLTAAADLTDTVARASTARKMITDYLLITVDDALEKDYLPLVRNYLKGTMSDLEQHHGNAKKCLKILDDNRDEKWVANASHRAATLDCSILQAHQIVEWLRKTNLDSIEKVDTYKELIAHLNELLVREKVPDQLALHNTLAYYFAFVKGYNACAFNFGQIVTECTKGVMMLHYSPTSDKGARRLAMNGSMYTMDDKNCCLHTVKHFFLLMSAKDMERSTMMAND